jgi:hypothetical protein
MAEQRPDGLPAEVQAVGERIARWRRTRVSGAPMPADLWVAAVALAQRSSVYRIARALSLDYGALRRRVADDVACPAGGAAGDRGFVEVSGAQLLGVTAPAGPVVEVAAGDGARLTIRLAADAALDVAGLVAGFCARRA